MSLSLFSTMIAILVIALFGSVRAQTGETPRVSPDSPPLPKLIPPGGNRVTVKPGLSAQQVKARIRLLDRDTSGLFNSYDKMRSSLKLKKQQLTELLEQSEKVFPLRIRRTAPSSTWLRLERTLSQLASMVKAVNAVLAAGTDPKKQSVADAAWDRIVAKTDLSPAARIFRDAFNPVPGNLLLHRVRALSAQLPAWTDSFRATISESLKLNRLREDGSLVKLVNDSVTVINFGSYPVRFPASRYEPLTQPPCRQRACPTPRPSESCWRHSRPGSSTAAQSLVGRSIAITR